MKVYAATKDLEAGNTLAHLHPVPDIRPNDLVTIDRYYRLKSLELGHSRIQKTEEFSSRPSPSTSRPGTASRPRTSDGRPTVDNTKSTKSTKQVNSMQIALFGGGGGEGC